jgi:hypothetical protein
MEQTAVQMFFMALQIRGLLPNEDFIEAYNQAKKIELEQRKTDYRAGWNDNRSKDLNCEFYLTKYMSNDFKSE